MKLKIAAIIQARMGSTRLPGKVLLRVLKRPLLYYMVERIKRISSVDEVIVATSTSSKDDEIESFCIKHRYTFFRGAEEDVLDRFYKAAKSAKAAFVVRFTADCPLIDPNLVEQLIGVFKRSETDYCSIATGAPVAHKYDINRFPDGMDAEIFTMDALEEAWKMAGTPLYREHVTPYIWKNTKRFKTGAMVCDKGDFSRYRWTLDNIEDYELIRWVYEQLYEKDPGFGLDQVLDLMELNPLMMNLNSHLIGKEGYDRFRN